MPRFSFCPNEGCPNHSIETIKRNWYVKKGFLTTKVSGPIQRYRCKGCGRTFSARTFSIDYFTKKKIDYKQLLLHQVTASGIRDMARLFNCSTATIQNRIGRLSRHITAVTAGFLKERTLDEHLAADGLESFVASQFFPDNINVLVGRKSQFVYDFNSYYFKRKGRTTEKQKKLKDILYKTAHFEKGGATRSFTEIINTLCTLWSRSSLEQLTLDTDENPIYQNCLKSNKQLKEIIQKRGFVHRLTNSKEERNFQNKLFPVNYIDRQIRKDLAEHVRETVQFSRNMNNCMERFNLYIFWHNYLKPYRINGNKMKNLSHAEVSGIPKETRGKIVESVFSLMGTRFKEVRMHLTPFQERCWIRSNPTPV